MRKEKNTEIYILKLKKTKTNPRQIDQKNGILNYTKASVKFYETNQSSSVHRMVALNRVRIIQFSVIIRNKFP